MRGLILLSALLSSALVASQVVTPPKNVTVKKGSAATFYCDLKSSTGGVMWSRYPLRPEVLYTPGTLLDPKYEISNTSGITIKDANFSDGLPYSCMALGQDRTVYYANLVVIGNLEASVSPSNFASPGDNITLTCSLQYGSPARDHPFSPLSPDQEPKISVYFGSEDLTSFANETFVPGTLNLPMHLKTVSVERILSSADVRKELRCRVYSVNPTYEELVNMTLPFNYSPTRVDIDVKANMTYDMQVYAGTLLNCSADGIPAPRVTWKSSVKNPSFEIVQSGAGYSVLKLVGLGVHKWNCTASNMPGIDAQAFSEVNVTVIGLPVPGSSKSGSVGLGVGLGIGLGVPILVGVVVLIFFLRRSKYSGYGKPSSAYKKSGDKKNAPITSDTGAIYKRPPKTETQAPIRMPSDHNGITTNPNPAYEQMSDASPPKRISDSPGYGDLGVKSLGASGSMPRLNESFDSVAERNYSRDARVRNYSSYEDEQYYPSRYHRGNGPDSSV